MDKKTETKAKDGSASGRLAAIRIRGLTQIKTRINDTLQMLRLYKNNYCSIFPNNPVYTGMLKQAKDYITWGEIDEETFKELVEKRGEQFNGRETDSYGKIKYNDFFEFNNKKYKKYFRLNAPKKGFGRKGVKNTFTNKGALGYRGTAIKDLIRRML